MVHTTALTTLAYLLRAGLQNLHDVYWLGPLTWWELLAAQIQNTPSNELYGTRPSTLLCSVLVNNTAPEYSEKQRHCAPSPVEGHDPRMDWWKKAGNYIKNIYPFPPHTEFSSHINCSPTGECSCSSSPARAFFNQNILKKCLLPTHSLIILPRHEESKRSWPQIYFPLLDVNEAPAPE